MRYLYILLLAILISVGVNPPRVMAQDTECCCFPNLVMYNMRTEWDACKIEGRACENQFCWAVYVGSGTAFGCYKNDICDGEDEKKCGETLSTTMTWQMVDQGDNCQGSCICEAVFMPVYTDEDERECDEYNCANWGGEPDCECP